MTTATSQPITAAVLREIGGSFGIEELELDAPRADEIRVAIAAVGVCHTDVKIAEGYRPIPLPAVLGHEGAGVVVDVGDQVSTVRPGDRVVISFDSCGSCPNCVAGHPAICDHGDALSFGLDRPGDGSSPLHRGDEVVHGYFFGQSSFATHAIATPRNVVRIGTDVPLERLGPLGCGVQTGAGAVLRALDVTAGSTLAVFGAGTVGLSAVMAAAAAGATAIVAVDRHGSRLELARELGATHTVDTAEVDPPDLHRAVTEAVPGGVTHALDTTNVAAICEAAFASLRRGGSYGHVGGGGTTLRVDTSTLLAGRSMTGIVQGDSVPATFIPELIRLHRDGRFPFDALITYYDLDEIDRAVADMRAGATIKPVLRMPSGAVPG